MSWPFDCGCNGWPNNGCGCDNQIPACTPTLPQQESTASQLQNLANKLFGPFQVALVNGRGIWTGLCSALSTVPGYPQNAGEGMICYLIRVITSLIQGSGGGFFTTYLNSEANLLALPTANGQKPVNAVVPVMNLITLGQLAFVQLIAGGGGTWIPNDYNAVTNNVSWVQVL